MAERLRDVAHKMPQIWETLRGNRFARLIYTGRSYIDADKANEVVPGGNMSFEEFAEFVSEKGLVPELTKAGKLAFRIASHSSKLPFMPRSLPKQEEKVFLGVIRQWLEINRGVEKGEREVVVFDWRGEVLK